MVLKFLLCLFEPAGSVVLQERGSEGAPQHSHQAVE